MKKVIPTLLVLVAMVFAEGVWLGSDFSKITKNQGPMITQPYDNTENGNGNSLRIELPKMEGVEDFYSNWYTYGDNAPYWFTWAGPERATQFIPIEFGISYPCTISKVRATFYEHPNYPWPDNQYVFKIYGDDGITLLWVSDTLQAVPYPTASSCSTNVNPPVVITSGNFYLAVRPRDASGHPSTLADGVSDGRSFSGSPGSWTPWTNGEFFFGAYISFTPVNWDMKTAFVDAPKTTAPYRTYPITAIVQNMGLNAVSAGLPVKMRITGPGGYVYEDLNEVTSVTLNQGDTTTIVFSPNWQAPYGLGTYTLKVWTELAGDQIPGNDTITKTIEVTNWLTYADWDNFAYYTWGGPERATYFTPPDFGVAYPVTIDTVKAAFVWGNRPWTDSTFKFKIYAGDGSTLLYESDTIRVIPTSQWGEIIVTHPVVPPVTVGSGGYYVALAPRVDSMPSSCADNDPDGHSFYGTPTAEGWTAWTYGELFIGSFVSWEANMNDVGITEITIPGPRPIWVGETRTVKVKIKNYGLNTQTSIPVAFYPGHGSEVNETWTGSLALGEEVEYEFTTQWNCNTVNSLFNFRAYTKLATDEYLNNDTATIQVAVCSPAGHTPTYTKDFNEQWGTFGDNPPFCGWIIQDYGNEPTPAWNFNDWFHGSLANPSRSVAAARYDIENNPPELQDEWLISPRLNCSGAGTYTLSFWHWYRGYSTEPDTGYVLLSTDGGTEWTLVDMFAGGSDLVVVDSGYKTYDITELVSGCDNVKIAFRYYAFDAYWWLIDDFVVTRTPPPGPATWNQSVSIPTNDPPKYVKDGGAMVATNNGIYAFKGFKSGEFKFFDGTTWTDKASIPFTVKPGTTSENKKYPGKGASLCWDGANTIYAIKGNGTREFWKYDISSDTWMPDSFVPPAKLKGGSSITYDNGKVYLLAAGQSQNAPNFFAYDVATSTWSTLTAAPHEPHNKKWGDGSALSAMNGVIYALKGKDKWNLFLAYTESGGWAFLETIPQAYDTTMIAKPKKTKVGDGGALTNDGTYLYAIKGAGKQDFWAYDPVTNSWAGLCTIPRTSMGKKSVPKTGAALAYWDFKVYLLKGNKLDEFWYYGVAPIEFTKKEPVTIVSTTNNTTNELTFNFIANPFSRTVNYTVPMSGKVTIKLYNASGRLIQTLNDGYLEAGNYTTLLPKVSSGVYFLKYNDGTNSAEAKIIVQ